MGKILEQKTNRIISQVLSPDEEKVLKRRRDTYIAISIAIYLLIVLFGIYVFRTNGKGFNIDNKSSRINFNDADTESYQKTVPYIGMFIVFASTLFFTRFLFNTIMPLAKDIRNGIKHLVYFTPEEPVDELSGGVYFLPVPFLRPEQIKLTKEEYNIVGSDRELCLEITPKAHHFLQLRCADVIVKKF